MDYSFAELFEEIPNEIFFDDKGDPNYNAIFVEAARRIYKKTDNDFMIPAGDFLNDTLPNLSSFQRAVSNERKRREE